MTWRKYEMPYHEYAPQEWSLKYIGSGGEYELPGGTIRDTQLTPNPNGRAYVEANVSDELHDVLQSDPDIQYLGLY